MFRKRIECKQVRNIFPENMASICQESTCVQMIFVLLVFTSYDNYLLELETAISQEKKRGLSPGYIVPVFVGDYDYNMFQTFDDFNHNLYAASVEADTTINTTEVTICFTLKSNLPILYLIV